jgi:hypothetical protein
MKNLFLSATLAALACLASACSPDVAISAGTAATAAAQQAEQAKIQKQMADQRIKAMQDSLQQHERTTGDIDEHADHPDRADRPAQ